MPGRRLIALAFILLTACANPVGQQVSEAEVATKVAILRLTANPVIPTQGGGVIQATIQTAIPELTTTPTPTLTSTTQPSDPVSWLGSATWRDTFSGSNNFYTTDDENISFAYSGTTFNMTAYNTHGWHSWSLGNKKIANFYLEATFKVGNCSGDDQYGLVFRAPDTSQGYFYGIKCNGQFALIRWDTMDQLIAWNPAVPLLSGSNRTNRVGVMARGTELSFFVNGNEVQKINDGRYSEGLFGFFIASYGTNNFNVQVEEVSYWNQ